MSGGTVTVTPCDADGTWLVALQGDHDLASRASIREQTGPVWPHCTHLVVDLTDVTFIDSGVIAWLLEVEAELEASGAHTLGIVEGPPGSCPARLFGLLRMRHVLACYATRAEALEQTPDGHSRITIPRPRGQGARDGRGLFHAT